ncbi:MAG: taurine dioxygenase [Alphaproteobacteria bacterium]|jgi:taurine dioxygenase
MKGVLQNDIMEINRLSDALGAEIIGLDVSRLDDQSFTLVKDAFLEHHVLVFRDQGVSPEEQIKFSARFGPVEMREGRPFTLDGFPEVAVLSNRLVDGNPVGVINAGDFWHSDLSFSPTPCRVTFLQALEVAEEGGDTEWSNMQMAYDALPDATKRRIQGRKGIHVFDRRRNPRTRVDAQFAGKADEIYGVPVPDALHPIVRTHPETGRKLLYVSPRFVVGIEDMDDEEAQPLLDELFAHQIQPQFRYRHTWRKGDLLIWDNPCLVHIGWGGITSPGIRHMHRTMVLGEAPL